MSQRRATIAEGSYPPGNLPAQRVKMSVVVYLEFGNVMRINVEDKREGPERIEASRMTSDRCQFPQRTNRSSSEGFNRLRLLGVDLKSGSRLHILSAWNAGLEGLRSLREPPTCLAAVRDLTSTPIPLGSTQRTSLRFRTRLESPALMA